MVYAWFGPRFLAQVVDSLLFAPLFPLYYFLFTKGTPGTAALSLIGYGLLGQAYPIICHGRWGQTVGKRVAGIVVTGTDFSPIGWKRAFLRSSVDIVLWIAFTLPMVYLLLVSSEPTWASLTQRQRFFLLDELSSSLSKYGIVSQIWFWSEVVVLLFNRKRRALHDFLAGTVVVKKEKQNA